MVYLTPEGEKKLEKELQALVSKRPEISLRIERAKELGDLKENAEYHDAKDEQGMIESRIREIESVLAQAQVVKKENTGTITLGSEVIVSANGKDREFQLVGASEAEPATGKISHESPLGKVLFGRKQGESVEVSLPAGKIIYQIKDVK